MTVFHTAALGWTAGQSAATTGSLLASFLSTNRANDTLVLDAQYSISGGPYQFPDDFTLEAVYGGGFTATDPSNGANTLRLGHRNRLINCRLGFSGAPTTGGQWTNKNFIAVNQKDDCEFHYCHFGGNVTGAITATNHGTGNGYVNRIMHFTGGQRHKFRNCGIRGGRWTLSVGISGGLFADDWTFEDCRFYATDPTDGDAIKTEGSTSSPGIGCRNWTLRNCVFEDLGRDGIDTTGGFLNAVLEDCIFRRMNWCGLDLKSGFHSSAFLGKHINQNITLRRCDFSNCRAGAVVMTTEDHASPRVLTAGNALQHATGNILLEDCIIENRGGTFATLRGLYSKSAFNTAPYAWTGLTVLGAFAGGGVGGYPSVPGLVAYDSVFAQFGWNTAAVDAVLNFGFTGETPTTGAARANSTAIPFTYGPQVVVPDPDVPSTNPVDLSAIWVQGNTIVRDTDTHGGINRTLTVIAKNAAGVDTAEIEVTTTAP